MKVRRILIIVLIAVIITAAFTISLELLSQKNNKPKTITDEPIVVTINPQTPETEGNPADDSCEKEDSDSTQNQETTDSNDTNPTETMEPEVEITKREIVNFETDPAKIVVPDDTHDELEIRVKAIIEDEDGEEFENSDGLGSEGMDSSESKKKTTGEGPNVGLLLVLVLLAVAFGGVFLYMNKLKGGSSKKKDY